MPFTFGSYIVSDADALAAALDFDEACLANYDFGGTSAPDGVDAADIGRMVGSRMVGLNAHEAAELIQQGSSAPWHGVPIDARLEDATPGSPLYDSAMTLFDHFQAISGVKAAKATKLLVMKRPSLFPVIDDRVTALYKAAAASQVGASHRTIASIRHDVCQPTTIKALADLRRALLVNGNLKALRLAQLTGLRLRDVVLWQHWQIVGEPPPLPPWPQTTIWK
jgi:hypothetical protein